VQPALRRCTVLPAADTVLAADDEVVMTRPVTLPASECQPLAAPVPIDLGAPATEDASLVGCTHFGPSMFPCGHRRTCVPKPCCGDRMFMRYVHCPSAATLPSGHTRLEQGWKSVHRCRGGQSL
jgi:hypothetical protein